MNVGAAAEWTLARTDYVNDFHKRTKPGQLNLVAGEKRLVPSTLDSQGSRVFPPSPAKTSVDDLAIVA
jgi:hypothetical protein